MTIDYSVTDLGGLTAAGTCVPLDLSATQQWVTGNSADTATTSEAFLWSGGSIQGVPRLPGFDTGTGYATNAAGDVAGYCLPELNIIFPGHAFVRRGNAAPVDLHPLIMPAQDESYAFDMNEAGDVVGYALDSAFKQSAWLFAGGTMVNLTQSVDATIEETRAINNAHQLVGRTASYQLFVYDYAADNLSLLSTFIEPASRYAINDLGQIAAMTFTGSAIIQPNGTVLPFAHGQYLDVGGINAKGQVACSDGTDIFVSDAVAPADTTVPTLHSVTSLLDTPGWTLTEAKGLDDSGAIVGIDHQTPGDDRGVLLTPHPLRVKIPYEAAFVQILFGVINDAPGFTIPGGPWDPGGPGGPVWAALSPGQRDAVLGLALNAGATLVSDRKARLELQRDAAALVRAASARLNPSTLTDRPAEQFAGRAAALARRTNPATARRYQNPARRR